MKLQIDLQKHKYVLHRLNDGKIIPCSEIKFVHWDDYNNHNTIVDEPAEGRSIIVDPKEGTYSWLTTPINEIIDDNTFKTKNSTYKLHKL